MMFQIFSDENEFYTPDLSIPSHLELGLWIGLDVPTLLLFLPEFLINNLDVDKWAIKNTRVDWLL